MNQFAAELALLKMAGPGEINPTSADLGGGGATGGPTGGLPMVPGGNNPPSFKTTQRGEINPSMRTPSTLVHSVDNVRHVDNSGPSVNDFLPPGHPQQPNMVPTMGGPYAGPGGPPATPGQSPLQAGYQQGAQARQQAQAATPTAAAAPGRRPPAQFPSVAQRRGQAPATPPQQPGGTPPTPAAGPTGGGAGIRDALNAISATGALPGPLGMPGKLTGALQGADTALGALMQGGGAEQPPSGADAAPTSPGDDLNDFSIDAFRDLAEGGLDGGEQPTGPTGGEDMADATPTGEPGGAATGEPGAAGGAGGEGAGDAGKPTDAAGHPLDFIFNPLGMGGMSNTGKWMGGIGGGLILLLLLSQLFGKRGSVEDYTDDERRRAEDLMDRMMKRATGQDKYAGLFYKDTEPAGIGMFNRSAPEPGNNEMFSMVERFREPRWLTKLWDNPGPNHQNDYINALNRSDQVIADNPDLFNDEDEHLRPLIAAQALLPRKRYRKIQPDRLAGLMADLGENETMATPPDVKEEFDQWLEQMMAEEQSPTAKAASYASAPRFSRSARGARPDGKYLPGHQYQGSTTKPVPRVRQSGADAAIDKMAFWELTKYALYTEEGGPISRIGASTLGRLNPLTLIQLILSRRAYSDPSRKFWGSLIGGGEDPERMQKQDTSIQDLAKAEPEALKDTVLRLGGTNVIDDLIWKKERGGEDLPWYKQLGGRVWHNPKSSILGKLRGTVSAPLLSIIAPLMRMHHYNPDTDVAHLFMNEPSVGEHEVGHALDYNKLYGARPGMVGNKDRPGLSDLITKPDKLKNTGRWFAGEGKGLLRDLYAQSRMLIPLAIMQEANANIESNKALKKTLGAESPEYRERNARRWETLSPGLGSYAGAMLPIPAGPLVGMGIGKAIGLTRGDQIRSGVGAKKPAPEPAPELALKAAAFGEKFAMSPIMSVRIKRQMIVSGPRKRRRTPSIKPEDNQTASTTDMAKSKDTKGNFAVT